jgi:hypothetical protein
MLKAVERRKSHSSAKRGGRVHDFNDECIYSGCYTLEPDSVSDAWATLSRDTFAWEIASYPALLHNAFLRTMKKRAKHA